MMGLLTVFNWESSIINSLTINNIMKGYIKIKTINLEPDKFGKHIKITRVGIYDENDKWIKWLPLNQQLADFFEQQKINVLINPDVL
jgi:hypothetical protein